MFAVIAASASVDPDIVDLAATTEQRRRAGAAAVVDSISSIGGLRDDLDRDQAIDVLWLLSGPAVFRQLVRGAGWSLDSYERWLAAAFQRELLSPMR